MKKFTQDADRICADNKSGATTIVLDVLHFFTRMLAHRQAGETLDLARKYAGRFIKSHPSMAQVINVCMDLIEVSDDPEKAISVVLGARKKMQKDLQSVVANAAGAIGGFDRIVIFSRSSLVAKALEELKGDAKILISEGRPINEGVISAREINKKGYDVTLTVDAALPGMIDGKDLVLLGCDCITSDFFSNKIGSLALALSARAAGAPLYVIAQKSKYLNHDRASLYKISDHPPTELGHHVRKEIKISNKYFEHVPLDLVKRFVWEDGVSTPRSFLKKVDPESR